MATDLPTDLRTVAAHLYGLRPDEFTAARTAAEKAARADGDRELAAAVKALRRPAVAAWAVNLLVRRRAELVEEVVELGEQLRQAQSLLQGDALRDLARQRRQLVTAVATQARALAAEEGDQQLSDAALRQVADTLHAAMTDRQASDAVRSGLLAQPLSSTGLESLAEVLAVPLDTGAPPAPPARPALTVVPDEDRGREEAQERVTAAGVAVRAAQKAFDKATKKRAKGEAKVLQLEAELEELRRRVAELEERTDAAAERLTDLDATLEESAARLEDARHEADAAAAALKELDG
jgi:chromosome segregation ATPase